MTLNDVARMLKLAKVPRSKTVEFLFTNPKVELYAPNNYVHTLRAVVGQIARPGQVISVLTIDDNARDVGPNEHVLFKVRGCSEGAHISGLSKAGRKMHNNGVVIDFARVAS